MRTYLSIVLLNFICINIKAQIPNQDFEQWTISGIDTTLNSWSQSSFGAAQNPSAFTGQYAVTVWNWYYYGKGYISNNLLNSLPMIGNFETEGGSPINYRPTAFSFFFKYDLGLNQGASDSAVVQLSMRKRNLNGSIDTIAYNIVTLPPTPQFTPYGFNINYLSSAIPDTFVISFLSSKSGFCDPTSDGNCLYLTIDNINFITTLNIEKTDQANFTIYPNPASNFLQTQLPNKLIGQPFSYQIVNISGQIIQQEVALNYNSIITLNNKIKSGIYFIKLEVGENRFYQKFLKQ
jgi:hypothetical protein